MIDRRRLVPRALVAAVAALGLLAASAPAMAGGHAPSGIAWGACADPDAAAAGWQCATFTAPKDYGHPGAGSVKVAVTRLPAQDQAHRTGSLFINYGGPGGDAVATTQAVGSDLFGALNDHFDLVAFDPETVASRATYADPLHYSAGIPYVAVNGQLVVDEGAITKARPGRPLRGPGYRAR